MTQKKTKKAHAIEMIIDSFKECGHEKNQITGDLIYQGLFDELGTEIIEGLESRGFAKGNLNDFYRYIKNAKVTVFNEPSDTNPISSDPIWIATKTVRDQLEAEAKHKLELVREECQEKLDDKSIEIVAYQKTCSENQKHIEDALAKISGLESERDALKLERSTQHDFVTKLQAANASLQVGRDDLKLELERSSMHVAEFKQELKDRFKLEKDKVMAETKAATDKAEGMSSHWAMEFDSERDAHKKTREERVLYKKKNEELDDRVQYLERDNQFHKGELSRIKIELTVAKGDQLERGIAQYESKILETLESVQTESMQREAKLNKSIHSFIYSPLKAIQRELDRISSTQKWLDTNKAEEREL